MPNLPPPPNTPNFTPGNGGRLATDRYDFESHVEGTGFRHKADQIDLFPTVVISSTTTTNVQQAIQLLAANLATPQVPQATVGSSLSNLGIVTLGGDFNGTGTTALAPKVGGIQGRPIQNVAPTVGQSLAWNGSFWTPTSVQPVGAAGGDLSGTYPNPTVVKLQGTSVSAVGPTAGQLLQLNGGVWTPTTISSLPPNGAAGGDLSGTYPNPTVAQLQGTAVSSTAPTGGQVLTFNGSTWIPSASGASGRAYFGSGTDGSAHFDGVATVLGMAPIPGAVYLLTRNIACASIIVDVGVTVVTQGFIIMCTGTFTVNGTIDNSGQNAAGTTGGNAAPWSWLGGGSDGGSGVHFNPPPTQQNGGNFAAVGTNQNIGLGGQGGTGGNPANLGGSLNNPPGLSTLVYNATQFDLSSWLMSGRIFSTGIGPVSTTSAFSLLSFGGGSGGGGGASPGGGPPIDGGGGGGGAGIIVISTNILAGNGLIRARGGAGANTAGWAGGGGGGGGVVVIIYNDKSSWSGGVDFGGGVQGIGPNGPGMPGFPGTLLFVQG